MNLYALKFTHYSPKDSEVGMVTYLCADSDEKVYEWLKSEPEVNGNSLVTCYEEKETDNETFDIYDDDYNVIGSETFKERMIRLRGEMNDEEADVCDAYYGVTHYGWELIAEGIYYTDVVVAKNNLKISIIDIN